MYDKYDGTVFGNPDGDQKLMLDIPTATWSFKGIFQYVLNKTCGNDLFDALTKTFGLNMAHFEVKFYHTTLRFMNMMALTPTLLNV